MGKLRSDEKHRKHFVESLKNSEMKRADADEDKSRMGGGASQDRGALLRANVTCVTPF